MGGDIPCSNLLLQKHELTILQVMDVRDLKVKSSLVDVAIDKVR